MAERIRRSSTQGVVGVAVAIGAILTGVLVAPLAAQAVVPIPTAIAQILSDTNALRAAGGLAPLTESTAMDTVAQTWSAQMYANNALTHNPNYSTQIPNGWTGAAENIASGYTYTSVVEAWHQSAGHYANIMGDYNAIGIGYYEANGQTYFTQDFGKYTTVPSPAKVVPGLGSATGSPTGSFDAATPAGLGTATVSGWDLDPDTASPITTNIYVDGTFSVSLTASNTRNDIAAAFPAYGAGHGWSTTLNLGGGVHNICAYAINTGPGNNALLGCRIVNLPSGSPTGSFDVATLVGPGDALVSGWDLDPDTASPVTTHVYVDGVFATQLTANGTRNDIAAAFPGYGASHGWSTSLSLTGGTHTICVYALNTAGPGDNALLGCRNVGVPTGSPTGSFDSISSAPGTIAVSGWDLDPDTASPVTTHVYVDGVFATQLTANGTRNDIAAAFPGYGASHGWSTSLSLTGGTHTICVYALNTAGAGNNALLGCRSATIPTGSPTGSFDSVTSGVGTATVSGWDLDPDTTSPVTTHVYVDGTFTTQLTANIARNDIAAAFPGYGAAHGWTTSLSLASGTHSICVYALNTGPGNNALLGCKNVTVPSAAAAAYVAPPLVIPTSFPSASTTGVPAGTALTAYTGPCTITAANTVIDAKTITCAPLEVRAKNVTISRSLINGFVYTDTAAGLGSFTISDSQVNVGAQAGTGIGDGNFTATRVHVTGGNRSINCYLNCTVQGSYVHGQFTDSTGVYHESGVRIGSGSVIRGNTIACTAPDVAPDAGCSAALTGYGDFAIVQNVTVDSNYFVAGSGGYCSYGGSTTGKPYSAGVNNIRFTNNVYQRGSSGKCGVWGAITAFDPNAPGNVWSNNTWDDGKVAVSAN